jgi:molybdopterin-containing oxidoreductase family membrane subunit
MSKDYVGERAEGDVSVGVIGPGHTFGTITDKISTITLQRRTPLGWFVGFAISFALMMMLSGGSESGTRGL